MLVQVQSALHSEIFLQPRQKQNAATLARRTETSFFSSSAVKREEDIVCEGDFWVLKIRQFAVSVVV